LDATTGPKVTFSLQFIVPHLGGSIVAAITWIALIGGVRGESIDLTARTTTDLRRVNVEVQVKGFLLYEPSGKPVQQLPILAKGHLDYEERVSEALIVRYYHNAEASIGVAEGVVSPSLDVRRRLIGVDLATMRPVLFSPNGPLTRSELDLVDVQGNSALLDRLLPGRKVAIGEKWAIAADSLAALLSLDAAYQADVAASLVSVDKGLAIVELGGDVSGSAGGVPSDLRLNATYAFEVAERRITSLSMAIEEKREIGPAEPGFEVSARVEVTIEPLERSNALTDEVLAQAARAKDQTLLAYISPGAGLRLLHARRWRMLHENEHTAVLRLIENGNVLAQCNLHRLADLAPDKLPTLEDFQADIKKSLGEHFGQFLEAGADETPVGLRRLRVTVSGIVSDVPIRWNYYHLSDNAGRQATCAFTLQQAQLEQLGDDDLKITGTIALENRPEKPRTTGTPETAARTAPNPTSRP
jgi:hypothetical protein